MARGPQTRGACVYCGREMTRSGLARHLAKCEARQAAIAAADERSSGSSETLYHLQVQDAYGSDFWLQLEMRGSAKLSDLDKYLRAIWLECCGHMSRFSLHGWQSDDIKMSQRVERLFTPDLTLVHQYDFGTTSETIIKVIEQRTGKATTRKPIVLMARNQIPEVHCMECGKPAGWYCPECLYELGGESWLCDEHAKTHVHAEYDDPIALVNSPRLGMCGYEGPAEPPY